MTENLGGELVLQHLEQFLGPFKERWLNSASPSLQVMWFPECPEPNSQCLVTYGLSAHILQIISNGNSVNKMELIICTKSSIDSKALAALLFAIGQDALVQHATPGVHRVLIGEGAVLSNPLFEHFYLTLPGYFPDEFAICEALSPPVTMVQLIPISSREREVIEKQGWRVFEDELVKQDIDLLAFDTRLELLID